MLIKFDKDFIKYTSFKTEVEIKAPTINSTLLTLFSEYPQLYAFLVCGDYAEAEKMTLSLNGKYLVGTPDLWTVVTDTDTLEFSRDVPEGAGGVGKIIVGAVLTAAAIIAAAPSGGTSMAWTWGYWTTMAATTGVSLMLGGVGQLIAGIPNLPNNGSSSTYTFSGIHNTTVSGTPIPVIYGRHRTGGQLLNAFVNTPAAGSDSFLYAQFGLSEGEIDSVEPNSIEINNRNAYDYDDVTVYWRGGDKDNTAGIGDTIMSPTSSIDTIPSTYSMNWTVAAPVLIGTTNIGGVRAPEIANIYSYVNTASATFPIGIVDSITDVGISMVMLNSGTQPLRNVTASAVDADSTAGSILGSTFYPVLGNQVDGYGNNVPNSIYIKFTDGVVFSGNLTINFVGTPWYTDTVTLDPAQAFGGGN